MATKQSECVNYEPKTVIEVEFDGAWLIDAGEGKVKFTLDVVDFKELPTQEISALMKTIYEDRFDADIMAEKILRMLEQDALAKLLAKRVRRTG